MELFEGMPGYLSGRLRRTKMGNYIAFIDFDTAQNAIFAKNKYNGYNFDTKTVPPNAINLPKHLIKKHGILIDFSRANVNHDGNGANGLNGLSGINGNGLNGLSGLNGINGLNSLNGNGGSPVSQIVGHNGGNNCIYVSGQGIIENIDHSNGYFNSLFYSRKYNHMFRECYYLISV